MSNDLISAEFRQADYDRIVKRLEHLADKQTIKKAINRAAKRSASAGRTATKELLADDTTLKTGDVGKKIKTYALGSVADMVIGMKISDTARPLSDFAFIPKKPKHRTAPTVEIHKGSKKKLSGQMFVAQMPTGHVGIYERETEEALPIRQLTGPSVTGLFKANVPVNTLVWNMMMETFEKRVEHELQMLLEG